jgi:hypothetical protein
LPRFCTNTYVCKDSAKRVTGLKARFGMTPVEGSAWPN